MNKYVLRPSLVWSAVLAIVAGIWAYRSHLAKQPIAMKMPMSGDVQPVASGPPAGANEPVPSMPGTKMETPLVPVQRTAGRLQSIAVKTSPLEYNHLGHTISH